VTRWDTDPWSLGSYSALAVGTSWRARQVLAEAVIGQRVVLAGEFVATDYPATVHGAYNSGSGPRVDCWLPCPMRVPWS
jgi:monoamine oxidase